MDPFQTDNTQASPRHWPAAQGWRWIVDGWGLFKQAPGLWIGMLLIWFVMQMIMGAVPIIGSLASALLGPALMAGFYLAARKMEAGEVVRAGDVLSGCTGDRFGPLVMLGLLSLGLGVLMIVLLGVVFIAAMGGMDFDLEQIGPMQASIGLLLFLVMLVPLMMALWFATSLVALHEQSPIEAVKQSYRGCMRNMGSLTVFGLVVVPLFIIAVIPFGLGLLVLSPVLILAMYRSYVDIYVAANGATTEDNNQSIFGD